VFEKLKTINKDYGNLILAFITLGLVIITVLYVWTTRETLRLLEKDYVVRSYPEIHILSPEDKVINEIEHLAFPIYNSGFQATNVNVDIVLIYNGEPVDKKITLLHLIRGKPFYSSDQIFRLASNMTHTVFLDKKEFTLGDNTGFLICVNYNSPINTEKIEECAYYHLSTKKNYWQRVMDKQIIKDLKTKSRANGLLKSDTKVTQ